jgi:hypothetical protein
MYLVARDADARARIPSIILQLRLLPEWPPDCVFCRLQLLLRVLAGDEMLSRMPQLADSMSLPVELVPFRLD